MDHSERGGAGSIRSAIDGLSDTARTAHDEIGAVSESVRSAVREIAEAATPGLSRQETTALESALHEVTADMQRTLDTLDDEITGAVDTHVAELETLLRTDRTGGPAGGTAETAGPSAPPEDEPPPLPPLDDIPALKGTTEWAEAVVERYPRLTVDEVLAIYHYTTVDGVDEMNGHLRHPENTPEAARAAIQQRIDAAVSGLKKLPKVPGVTFRGTYIPEDILPDWRAGARVSDAAFYSSSTDAAVAEDFRLSRDGNVFVTITGATGVDVQALSHFGDEAEILFQPGTEWRVITAEWDERRTCWDLDVVEVTR